MLREIWEANRPAMIALAALVLAILSTLVVVPETEQAVVIRLGEPDRQAKGRSMAGGTAADADVSARERHPRAP